MIDSPYAIKTLFYIVFQALGVYFNLYFLVPRYLEKGRLAHYVLYTILTIIAMAAIIVPGYFTSAVLAGTSVQQLYGTDEANFFYFFRRNTLPSSAAAMTLAMSVKFTKNWLQSKRREQLLEREKLETELKFLRSQFHPHFLFNTINSIFVLIRKNPDMASDALERFSSLLRYQLYECNEKQIPLRRELSYIHNYFELQKLRQDRNIQLRINMPDHPAELSIAPFILVSFIENAFKHVSRQIDRRNFINLDIRTDQHVLFFDISNSAHSDAAHHDETKEYSGIGQENVRRRLELVYPNKHTLEITATNKEFNVKLRLELESLSPNPQPAPKQFLSQVKPLLQ